MTETTSRKNNVYLTGSVLCALIFSILSWYRIDLCHSALPLTYLLVGIPLLGTLLGGRSFFEPKSGGLMVLAKLGIICTNLCQFGFSLLLLTGLSVLNCG